MSLLKPKNSFQENIRLNLSIILVMVVTYGSIIAYTEIADSDAEWSWNPLTQGFWSHLLWYAGYLVLAFFVAAALYETVLTPLRRLLRKWNAPDDREAGGENADG